MSRFNPGRRPIAGTTGQITVSNGDGVSGNPTISIPVGATGLMRPTIATVSYDTELAPAISTWTGSGGSTWDGTAWTIPALGTLQTNVTVELGAEYQINITWTNTNAYDEVTTPMLKASLGTAVSDPQFTGYSDALYKLTLTANETGSVVLKLGDGIEPWSATITNISVKKVLSKVSSAGKIGVGSFDIYTGGTNFAIGGGHINRTSGDGNSAFGIYAQQNLTAGNYNSAFGVYAQQSITTGLNNVGLGYQAQRYLKTGYYNIGIGYYAQGNLTYGSWNIGIGNESQRDLTTGHRNTAVGSRAMNSLQTGNNNVAIGRQAGFAPLGNVSFATISGSNQVVIGMQSGQSSSVQADNLTAIGFQARGTTNATALGAKTTASGIGAVAIGVDSAGNGASASAQDNFVLGTALHKVKIPGVLNMAGIATANPLVAGQIWSNNGVLTVSAG